jgi:hypothetical protein
MEFWGQSSVGSLSFGLGVLFVRSVHCSVILIVFGWLYYRALATLYIYFFITALSYC